MNVSVSGAIDEAARKRFEAAYGEGHSPAIENFIPPPENSAHLATLEELVHIELEFAWKRGSPGGVAARIESYLARFPQLNQPAIVRRLLEQEYSVRQRFGDKPQRIEYESRFPGVLGDESTIKVHPPREPSSTPPPKVPGYEIVEELGRGGMGVVYKARQLSLRRTVALKMILCEALPHAEDVARFRREAESIAQLQNPNIVDIYDIEEHEGQPFIALEFVDGGNLSQKIHGRPQPPREAAELMSILARAMHHVHERGILHRDLKPGNILLTRDGTPKITDFGLAKCAHDPNVLTQPGALMGTPCYAPPEQAEGKDELMGRGADVYALGAILYEMLTGRPPFRGRTPLQTVQQILSQQPVPPSQLRQRLPLDLEAICLKCLNKSPQERYEDAAALADDLDRFLAEEPVLARPAGPADRTARWFRRNRTVALASAVVVAALITVAIALFVRRAPTPAPPPVVGDPPAFIRAHAFYETGNYQAALPEYNSALQSHPKHRAARFERAVVRTWANDARGALDDLRTLVAADSSDLESRRMRALLEVVRGDVNVAASEAEALLRIEPNSAPYQVLAGQAALRKGDKDASRKHLDRAKQIDPRTADGLYQQAGAFLNARVGSVANLQYRTVLAMAPEQRSAYYGLGFSASLLGDTPAAIEALETYLRHDPTGQYADYVRAELTRLRNPPATLPTN